MRGELVWCLWGALVSVCVCEGHTGECVRGTGEGVMGTGEGVMGINELGKVCQEKCGVGMREGRG